MSFKKIIRFLPPILWMSLMFMVSSKSDLPSNEVYVVDFVTKKFSHIAEYFILTVLWSFSLNRPTPDKAVLYTLIFAFTDEIHQIFVPNRMGNLRDVGIDLIGISIAAVIMSNIKSWKNYIFPRLSRRLKK